MARAHGILPDRLIVNLIFFFLLQISCIEFCTLSKTDTRHEQQIGLRDKRDISHNQPKLQYPIQSNGLPSFNSYNSVEDARKQVYE